MPLSKCQQCNKEYYYGSNLPLPLPSSSTYLPSSTLLSTYLPSSTLLSTLLLTTSPLSPLFSTLYTGADEHVMNVICAPCYNKLSEASKAQLADLAKAGKGVRDLEEEEQAKREAEEHAAKEAEEKAWKEAEEKAKRELRMRQRKEKEAEEKAKKKAEQKRLREEAAKARAKQEEAAAKARAREEDRQRRKREKEQRDKEREEERRLKDRSATKIQSLYRQKAAKLKLLILLRENAATIIQAWQRQQVSKADVAKKRKELAPILELLKSCQLEEYRFSLIKSGVSVKEDLQYLDKEVLVEDVGMKPVQAKKFMAYRDRENDQTSNQSVVQMQSSKPFAVFLSHYKDEAGETARYLKENLDQLMVTNGQHFQCFLDCDDLHHLDTLLNYVSMSSTLIIILTKNVFTRPWCVLEIVTAVEAGKKILPVQVLHPQKGFSFDDADQYHTDFANAPGVTQRCLESIYKYGMTLERVQVALEFVLNTIALKLDVNRAHIKVLHAQVGVIHDQLVLC